MSKRRPRSDDILFISAIAAVLLGVAFLLYTTGAFVSAPRAWPILVMAVGGLLLYFALVRGASPTFLFGGTLFVLEGAFALASLLLEWKLSKSWPLGMGLAGLAGLVSGFVAKRRLRAFYAVPSIGFAVLGGLFSLFSFGLAGVNLRSFIAVWWPTLLIAGGISLFVAYGISRRAAARSGQERPRKKDRLRSEYRGPSSGP
jgi:hypothetical protein